MKLLITLLLISTNALAYTPPVSRYPIPFDLSDIDCLARNIYHEARGQDSSTNLAAIAFVVLHRVKSESWPDSICEVVYQQRKSNHGYVAMFSWTLDDYIISDFISYNRCLTLAREVYHGRFKDPTRESTHYHSTKVTPYWSSSLRKTVTLGSHIFYK